MSNHRLSTAEEQGEIEETLDSQTVALRWIAGLLIAGAAWLLAPILVPFVLGLVLSIALSPLADRLERLGLGRTGSSLACLILVTAILAATSGLLAFQVGTIVQQSDRYLDRMSQMLSSAARAVGGERLLASMGVIGAESEGPPEGPRASRGTDTGDGAGASRSARSDASHGHAESWGRLLRDNLRVIGGWLLRGLGGFVGLVGSGVILLSFVFYMLHTRSEWIDRLIRIFASLGMRPRRDGLERTRSQITTFVGFVVMVSICGAIVTGTTAWLLGLPQPFLWGAVFGLLEFVPYFGPMVGGSLLTLVALAMGGGGWWQPVVMLAVLLTWLALEGYVITPMVYGKAVRFDPVSVLVAVLFFGWLWGPLGMVTALPMMVLLRELTVMSPETPALDALMEPERETGGAAQASN
jgi:predicted PurR-regulated permease PerM